jgi:hypothetical protein
MAMLIVLIVDARNVQVALACGASGAGSALGADIPESTPEAQNSRSNCRIAAIALFLYFFESMYFNRSTTLLE